MIYQINIGHQRNNILIGGTRPLRGSSMGKLEYYFIASKASLGQVLSICERKKLCCEMTFAPPTPEKGGI